MQRSALRVGVAAICLFGSTHANAEGTTRGLAFLEWTRAPGAEGCLAEEEMVEDVERSLKRRVFVPRAVADRVLRATIAPARSGWHATIDLATKDGMALGARELDFEESDCREASNVLVLAISLMANLPVLPSERTASPPARHTEPSIRFRAATAPAMLIDDRPSVRPGADLSLEVIPRAFVPIVADLLFQLQTPGAASGESYWLFGTTLGVSLCPLYVVRARLELLTCAGPELTVYASWGRNFVRDATAFSSTVGALVQARGTYAITARLRAFLAVGAVATPQQVDIVGDGVGQAQFLGRTPYVTGLAALGLSLEL